MRALYITCCDNGLFGLKRLAPGKIDIAAVVCLEPHLGEKYNISGFVDPAPYCLKHDIPVVALKNYTLKVEDVVDVDYDVVIVNGWNRLIPEDVFSRAPHGGLGIHAGHPPIGLGRAPLVWNILLGMTDLEAYVFRLTANADDGDIMARQCIEITPHDDVQHVYEKVMRAGVDLFATSLERLASGESGEAQNLEFAQHYEKRTPDDGLIDFSQTDSQIHDFVRAQAPPYPGAFTYLNGQKWTIHRAVPYDRFAFRDALRKPGQIVDVLPSGIVVLTGGAPIWIQHALIDGAPAFSPETPPSDDLIGSQFKNQ